jgi:hypothetical protein
MISRFFKRVFKIVSSNEIKYLLVFFGILILTTWVILNIYKVAIIAGRETIKTADYLIVEEQKRDLARFEEKTAIAAEHIDELQIQLKDIKVGRWSKFTEEQKRSLLTTTWKLRKDSLRIENALINQQNDFSVNFYPRKDTIIEEKFKEYWRTHILINRVIDDAERIIYTAQGIDKFQLQKLQENLEEVKRMVDHK